jgi:hypothetical protein
VHIVILFVLKPLSSSADTSSGTLRIFAVAISSNVKHYRLSLRGFEVLRNDKSMKNVILDKVDIKQELFPLYDNGRHVT